MMQRHASILTAFHGYHVEFIDIFDFFNNYEHAMTLESRCFDGNYLQEYFNDIDIVTLNASFLDHILSYEWDILLLCTVSHYSYFLLPSTLQALKETNKFVVGFLGDDETMFHRNKFWVGLFDAIIAYSENEVKQYQQWNQFTYLLPIGIGELPQIVYTKKKTIDVIFVGRPYGVRVEMIRAIKNAGINIQVFGNKQWLDYPDLADIYQGFLGEDVFWQQLGQAKIVLNLMEDVTGNQPHINAKVFEAAMIQAFSLATYYAPFETTYGLKEKESIAFYRGAEDLVAQIKYYLIHEKERKQIAEKSQHQLITQFSYTQLYQNLIAILESQWKNNFSGNMLRHPLITERFSIIQFVTDIDSYNQAQQSWSQLPAVHIVFVGKNKFIHSGVCSISTLRKQMRGEFSHTLREYIVFAASYTIYTPAMFNLIAHYGDVGLIKEVIYCDSIVQNKRLTKSIHFLDLNSSIWRRGVFLKHSTFVLSWYQWVGATLPNFLVKFKPAYFPILLNSVKEPFAVFPFHRYRQIVEFFRYLKTRF